MCVTIAFLAVSLLQQLVELREELSKLLRSDVQEQTTRLREAQSETCPGSSADFAAMDSDLSNWLGDCVDTDAKQKVPVQHDACS